ncbi:MAG: class I SAM-dependent methyltransferase [Clostridia bacterium]|nr:class I SAM-dependent methyltransferase [Clostridia bacterium]
MLDRKGFDLWADGYDQAVGISDTENTYPFAGYREVLGRIFKIVMERPEAAVLDIGFGTGTLTAKLYENGCTVYGQDFSSEMICLASVKMPGAYLYQGDFSQGLAAPLLHERYDFIVATYSLHHLTDARKIPFLRLLRDRLKENGRIMIGDVAFETRRDLELCRLQAGDDWDGEEYYFVADEMKRDFPDMGFTKVSYCAGILTLPRPCEGAGC